MKKYIVGFVAGVVMAMSATAFADDIQSLIGSKVQKTANVTLNGSSIGSAVIINNTSYAPVRVVGEASGLEVGYENGVIVLESEISPTATPTATPSQTPVPSATPAVSKKKTTEQIKSEITICESTIKTVEDALIHVRESIASGKYTGDDLNYLNTKLAEGEKTVELNKAKIVTLQAQLAELQGQ